MTRSARSHQPRRWPPPGLERTQGDLGRIAARGALAGGLLVLPMLFVVAREQGFSTLGPLADAWWMGAVLAAVGLAFSIDTLWHAARLLRRAARAVGHGYGLDEIVRVAADTGRDMGFLLQGARHFVVMDPKERDAMLRIRIFAVLCHAFAGLWLSAALGVGLLAAARGVLSPAGLSIFALLPAGALYAFGGVGLIVQEGRVRRARRAYHDQPWSRDLASGEIERWRAEELAATGERPRAEGTRAESLRRWLVGGAVAMGFVGVLIALPVMTLLPTSIAGPVLSALATPRFEQARTRAATAEAYRTFVVVPDPALDAQQAGQLLHDLSYVGVGDGPSSGEKPPSRRFDLGWLPDTSENPFELDPHQWGDALIETVVEGTTGTQRAYLAQVAAHPARAEFSRLASASGLDVAFARWEQPLPDEVTIATMPLPRYGQFRLGAQAHLGAAAYALVQGDEERAEQLIREVISVGFLLGDDGPTLIDNLIGYTLVDVGGRALSDLFAATGDDARLERLLALRGAARRAADRADHRVSGGTESWLRSLPAVVVDSATVRGVRWEYFMSVTTFTPCLNLHRMVFGPDAEYEAFLEEAHDALVLHPSEEGLFALARRGWLETVRADEATLLGRFLSVSMSRGESGCGEVIRRLETARELF